MRTTRSRWAAGTLVAAMLIAAPAAQAGLLEDILAMATAARDRATEARDRATEARNNAASARDRAIEARNNAASARDTAITARDTAIEMRDNMQAGLTALTDEIQTAIEEAIEDLQRTIEDEVEGRDAFLAGGAAEPFRQNLIALFQRLETLINTLYDIAGMENTEVDFGRLISVIEALPVRALYPLYRTLAVEFNLFEAGGLLERMDAAPEQLRLLAQVLDEPAARGGEETAFLDEELDSCAFVLDNYTTIKLATRDLTWLAGGLKLAGIILKAAGETEIHSTGGVWGWVGVSLKNNSKKQLGVVFDGVAEFIFSVTRTAGIKMRHCAGVAIQDEARERDREILHNQQVILRFIRLQTGGPD